MKRYKILAVDDDYASRLLLKKVLEHDGYQVTICSDGIEAIEILDKQAFDVVVTDLIMESIGGIELLEKIKKTNPEIAVILLTGHASIETAIQAVRLGASDYLIKPLNLEELRIRLRRTIERVELERRLKEAERQLTYNATIATANHEINQPLTVIISAIEMIRLELHKLGINNQRITNYLELLNKSSTRIADILRRLRSISSPRIQEFPLGMKMVDLGPSEPVVNVESKYVLVIEDEENIRKIIRSVLESAKFKVILAETAREGIDLYRADRQLIEVVILDFNLPDANGLQVLQRLQQIHPSVKVVLTSGFNVDESIQEALHRGAIHFIRKPFSPQQLLDTIRQVYFYHTSKNP